MRYSMNRYWLLYVKTANSGATGLPYSSPDLIRSPSNLARNKAQGELTERIEAIDLYTAIRSSAHIPMQNVEFCTQKPLFQARIAL